jgi:hypothetical protein
VGLSVSALSDSSAVLGKPFVDKVTLELQKRTDSVPAAVQLGRLLSLVQDFESVHATDTITSTFKDISTRFPSAYFGFVSSLCSANPALWPHALQIALDAESSQSKTTKHTEMLKSVLEQASVAMKPEQLISILPDEGDALFFLPYIELCLSQSSARALLANMKTSVQADLDNPNSGLSNFSTSVLYGPWKSV